MARCIARCFAATALVCIIFAFGCSGECGLEQGAICNGGICERGDCLCPSYLIGPNCKYRCPGPESSPCNDRGKCLLTSDASLQNAVCFCVEQFRGLACTIPCPVFSGSVCSGRGLCNTNGTCTCIQGFVGSDCSKECAGGSLMPCSGWGTCLSNGSCACDAGRYGEHCQAHCASNKGIVCSGRGECSNKTGRCLCAQFPGSTLISGYYGDACEFVRYNRSGVSAFSTSVQSASTFQVETPSVWVIAITPLVVLTIVLLTNAMMNAKK